MNSTVEKVREDIPFLDSGIIYLDNAATTPTPAPVLDEMTEYYYEYNANIGRGLHSAAKRASNSFESAREKIGKTIGAESEEIAFTKNTTEALNLLARGLDLKRGDKVIATVLEHHSNLIPWQIMEEERGVELEIVKECSEFIIEPSAIESAIDEDTKLITMPWISNVFGTRQPVREVGKIARENDLLFCIDAAQAVGHMPVDVDEVKCDFLAAPGHKGLLGPQGTGFLYIRKEHLDDISPLLYGGGIVKNAGEHECQLVEPPQVYDAGTPNIPGIIGLGRAAEYVMDIGLEEIERRERELIRKMSEIRDIGGVEVYGPKSPEKIAGVLSFNLNGMDSHEVSSILDEVADIATRSGHHCADPAMGYFDLDSTARASVHYYNTEEEIEEFIKTLTDIAEELV